jgi:Big-like domain-containing protein
MRAFQSIPFVAGVVALGACALDTGPTTDGSAPLVAIISPAGNSTVGGQVSIDATAVDDFRVDEVRILIDGGLQARIFTPPYHMVWNASALPDNSTHTIRAEALDPFGNLGVTQIVVTVLNGRQ